MTEKQAISLIEITLDKKINENESFIKYTGPKSISILGQTGWNRAYARKNEGGGGLMS